MLVLSEFAGAADELGSAIRINPHDIDGLKDAIMRAVEMPAAEQGRRMRALRRRVLENDTSRTGRSRFLERARRVRHAKRGDAGMTAIRADRRRPIARPVAGTDRLLVALDFDGTLVAARGRADGGADAAGRPRGRGRRS